MKKQNKKQGRKQIRCYKCNSDRVTAYLDFSSEPKPRPKVNFSCAECTEYGVETPIMSLEIPISSMEFVFFAEDTAKKYEKLKLRR